MALKKHLLHLLAAVALAVCPLFAGCSIGYVTLHPGENSALYAHLFGDIIGVYDQPYWLWIRGSIAGDLTGDGKVGQEFVLATIQKGDEKSPGPIDMAILVACEVSPEGERTALARTVIFSQDPLPGSPRPVNDLGQTENIRFTRAKMQLVQDKVSFKETVVVYFYGDDMPGTVWYAGYVLEDGGRLEKNLETAMWQPSPGFLVANLDRAVEATPYGYQLLFSVAALPENIARELGSARDTPLWGHVFARGEDGVYRQADERFGEHYRGIESGWNKLYLKAMLQGMSADQLAWFEYHMGLLNQYTGNHDLGRRFLEKARDGSKDPLLTKAIRKALDSVNAQ